MAKSFDLGTMHIFLVWFPLIGRCVGEFRHAIGIDPKYWSHTSDLEQKHALRAITKATFETCAFFVLVIIVTAILVPLKTNPLDPRMLDMVEAFSRILSGLILGMLSIRVACWLDVYYKLKIDLLPMHALGSSIRELKFRVRWAVSKKILRLYYCFLVVWQGVNAIAIPVSIVAGVVAGLLIDFFIYKLRRVENEKYRWYGCFVLVLILIFGSIAELAVALSFIQEVWITDDGCDDGGWTLPDIGVAILIPLFPIIHIVYWHVGKAYRKKEQELAQLEGDERVNKRVQLPKQRMVYSMFISERRVIQEIQNATMNGLEAVDEGDEEEEDDDEEEGADKVEAPISPEDKTTPTSFGSMSEQSSAANDSDRKKEQEEEEVNKHDSQARRPSEGIPSKKPSTVKFSENSVGGGGDGKEGDNGDRVYYEESTSKETDTTNNASDECKKDTVPAAASKTPTYWELFMSWKFCGCVREDDKTCFEKTKDVIVWILYVAGVALCVLSLINNSGATYQQVRSRCKLPYVADVLYTGMDDREVCAFNNSTADWTIPRREWTEQPMTFDNKTLAHLAGYSVLHCGACAACSDWVNLELEYTTRKFLAEASRDCAIEDLFGGTEDGLVHCLEGPTIGFQGKCAECWATDIECTQSFCAHIGIQSFFINTLANFAVGPGTVTAATCEEANCEGWNPGDFVGCSGANRRRMGITSTIPRPVDQQCNIVDVDWAVMFPDVHPYESVYAKPETTCEKTQASQAKAPPKDEEGPTFDCDMCNRVENFTHAEEESLLNSGHCH